MYLSILSQSLATSCYNNHCTRKPIRVTESLRGKMLKIAVKHNLQNYPEK
jgi:hypothetical protein